MTPKKNEDTGAAYAIYKGGGAFIQGVPTRDLSRAEWDALTADQKAAAAELYALPQESE
jgi:hypothetical protein